MFIIDIFEHCVRVHIASHFLNLTSTLRSPTSCMCCLVHTRKVSFLSLSSCCLIFTRYWWAAIIIVFVFALCDELCWSSRGFDVEVPQTYPSLDLRRFQYVCSNPPPHPHQNKIQNLIAFFSGPTSVWCWQTMVALCVWWSVGAHWLCKSLSLNTTDWNSFRLQKLTTLNDVLLWWVWLEPNWTWKRVWMSCTRFYGSYMNY